ncbi:MAG: hypothetical protein INR62_13225 [Rhodospirillales bacterium]|nr:hypothetical protein [Acetobacter sp.]
MTRSNLLLAGALAVLPFTAFAQGSAVGNDSKAAAQPTVTATQPATTNGTTAKTEAAATTPAGKAMETQDKAAVKADAPAKKHAAVKTMHVNHANTAAPAGTHVKPAETPKS